MAQVLPAERDLRRVIGDGEGIPDAEVDGLDERTCSSSTAAWCCCGPTTSASVVYHRQGRIGTYAIFWDHEAMQAGAAHALERRRLDLPELPRVGDRPPARHAGRDGPLVVARPSRRAGGTRATTTSPRSASRSRRTSRTRPGSPGGRSCAASRRVALAFFGDGATSEGAFHEGANFAAVMQAPLDPLLQQQRLGDLDAALGADARPRRSPTRRRATGCPAYAWTGPTCSPSTRRRARRSSARARGDGPDVHRGGDVPRRAARHRRRPERVHRRRAGRGGARSRSASAASRATSAGSASSTDELAAQIRAEACRAMRAGIAAAEAEPPPDPSLLFEHALRRPAARRSRRDLARAAGDAMPEMAERARSSRRSTTALHVELERDDSVMVMGEDVGRAGGVFRATAGLRDRFGPDRCVDTPLAEAGILGTAVGLCMAGWRPVCEMQYDAFSYPCLDQLITPRRPLPLAHRRRDGVPARRSGCPTAAASARRSSTTTRPRRTTCTRPGVKVAIPATPADAKGLLAAAIRDPDPVVILEPKLAYRTPRGEVPGGRARRPARAGARRARGRRRDPRRATARWCRVGEQAADALAGEACVEVLDLRTLKPLDEEALLASVAKTGRVVIVQEAPRTCRLRGRARRDPRREGDPRPPRPVLRVTGYDVPTPTGSSRTRTCRPSRASSTRRGACSRSRGRRAVSRR